MPRLDTRQEQLLSFIVREHTATAEPVASELVRDKAGLGVSPATIRAEMAALEKEGYLRQPHTSAGRVPTEAGYRYFVEHCVEKQNVRKEVDDLQGRVGQMDQDQAQTKQLARELAALLQEGIFVGFAPTSTYYTGLAYLFEQPEFQSGDLVRHIGALMDNLDRIVSQLFDEVAPGVRVYVGSENPFGEQCGTVLIKAPDQRATMLGVIGPMRMDYDRTIAMMQEIENVLWKN